MARHFTVTLTSGTNSGPYTIYHTSIDSNNIATIYGTSDLAENLTLTQVQNGVLVSVPDNATSVFLVNTNPLVQSDCPTYFVEYPLTANPTSTPFPTATPEPTPGPTNEPTPGPTNEPTPNPTNEPTPNPTNEPTATPEPTPGPTNEPTPNPTATPEKTPGPTNEPTPFPTNEPTATPTATAQINGSCHNVWVSPEVDTARTGLRWNNPENGLTNQVFGSMLSVPYTYNNQEGFVVSVCSTLFPSVWDQQSNTTTPIDGVLTVDLGNGGVCTKDIQCVFDPEPTETPIPTATPNPTTAITCVEYSYDDSASFGDPDRRIYYNDCDGIAQSFIFPPGGYGVFCAEQGSASAQYGTTTILLEGDCTSGDGVGPTSTPPPTPNPTASPTAAVSCTEYTYDDSASFGDPNRQISYMDCSGNPQLFSFPPGGYGTFCAQTGTVSVTYGTTNVTDEGPCSTGTTPAPTNTPPPTPTSTLVVAENEFYISSARFSVSDFCDTNYLASTLVFGTGFNTQISGLQDETLYNSNNTPYQGNPSRYYFISTNQNAGSQTSIGPQYVVIDIDGVVLSVGSIDCESGGGDPENPFNEGIEPTSTPQ